LKLKKLIHHMNSPCAKCPYKLGLVHTVVNPCPQCNESGYQTFERFQKQALGDGSTSVHIPDREPRLHGVLAPPCRKGAPLFHEQF